MSFNDGITPLTPTQATGPGAPGGGQGAFIHAEYGLEDFSGTQLSLIHIGRGARYLLEAHVNGLVGAGAPISGNIGITGADPYTPHLPGDAELQFWREGSSDNMVNPSFTMYTCVFSDHDEDVHLMLKTNRNPTSCDVSVNYRLTVLQPILPLP